ncbi:hypothetical protein IFM89_021784 [Coptis chinensis]|uniref:Pus10 N-terminal eukaryotes domain-containing protein n=1 Tax=Coptis chinensis TaxID=261450 RepID=A0A835IPD6_9MAGN|nr:hypothetical protein IFM89_021784 [Coptis chinensis]
MTSGKEDDDVSVTVTDTDTEVEGIIMTNNNNNNKSDEEAQIIEHAVRSLPSHAAAIDLLSSGVCVRCILRLFGVSGRVYSCSLLSSSYLYSVLEKSYSSHDSDTWRPSLQAESPYYCSVCLGILQFCHTDGKVKDQVSEFTLSIAEMVKKEGHEIESFCFEISVPPIISANENAIWLCMKNKYGSELWCQEEKLLAEHVSLKDALKMSVTDSLETLLAGKYALGSFHICLTYTQTKASSWLLGCQDRNQDFKRRKTGMFACLTF